MQLSFCFLTPYLFRREGSTSSRIQVCGIGWPVLPCKREAALKFAERLLRRNFPETAQGQTPSVVDQNFQFSNSKSCLFGPIKRPRYCFFPLSIHLLAACLVQHGPPCFLRPPVSAKRLYAAEESHRQPCCICRAQTCGFLDRRQHHLAVQNIRLELHEQ